MAGYMTAVFGKDLKHIEKQVKMVGKRFSLSLEDWYYNWDSISLKDCISVNDFESDKDDIDIQAIVFDYEIYCSDDNMKKISEEIIDKAILYSKIEALDYKRVAIFYCHR